MIKRIRIAFLAFLVAVLGGVGAASMASATTGGFLFNSTKSNYHISVTNTHPAGNWGIIEPGWGTNSNYNVQGFLIKYGCKGRSQYSGTSWPYVGGNIYYYSQNNLSLTITVYCP